MVDTELPSSLAKLNIPSGFARFDSIIEPEVIARLEAWKSNASHVLSELRTLLEKASELSLDQQADIISSVAPLASDGTWVTPDSRQTAQGARCSTFLRSDVAEIIHRYHVAIPTSRCSVTEAHLAQKRQALVLSQSTSPSQHIHWAQAGSTCRRTRGHIRLLRRPSLEREPRFSVHRGIRSEPSSGMLFKSPRTWIMLTSILQSDDYERLWPLLIPPLMTLLDDFQAPYKLHGVNIVREMLRTLPKQLLKRTGLHALLAQVRSLLDVQTKIQQFPVCSRWLLVWDRYAVQSRPTSCAKPFLFG